MDYKRVLRLHFINKLSSRAIAANCGCGKTSVNEFIKRFNESDELTYPLPDGVTNEYIQELLYEKPGSKQSLLYRDFDEETVYRALSRKGETLKHLWQKYNSIGSVDGKQPMSYRQYCRRYSEWTASKNITFHIQRYPGINTELDYAGKTLCIRDRKNPSLTQPVTVFMGQSFFLCDTPATYSAE